MCELSIVPPRLEVGINFFYSRFASWSLCLGAAATMSKVTAQHHRQVDVLLDAFKDQLNDISQEIWNHPETLYQEVHAHEILTDFLEQQGFEVVRGYKDLVTAFRANFQSTGFKQGVHPTVCVICEYDALPQLGHACGHNLIAEAGVAAGLAIRELLRNGLTDGSGERVQGQVVVLGTPAEEGAGGKVDLIRAGAFKDIDFAMMVHPFPHNDLEPVILGINRCLVKFHGKAAHASCGPWEGINALDAAVAVYNNVALFRQQMKPNWRIHGTIVNGGAKPNIIPDLTVSHYYMRTQTAADMKILIERMLAIFAAAAKATGCTHEVEWEGNPYTGMLHNSTMANLYQGFSADAGAPFEPNPPGFNGSTDMGNVSIEVPSIHPCIFIGQPYLIHTTDMCRQAGSPEAQPFTLIAAKAMALTTAELLLNKDLREKAQEEFQLKKRSFVG